MIFQYSQIEIEHLKSADTKLCNAIEQIGFIEREIIPDLFMALVNSIVGQQISSKALATIWERVCTVVSPMTPQAVSEISAESLQKCGISNRKVSYIKELAECILSGKLNLNELYSLSDDEVCNCLCEIKGIGKWTAEMIMIFSMKRRDILSFGDLGIQRGLRMLYRHKAVTPALFAKYNRRFSPYSTVASFYLWAISSGEYDDFTDPAPKAKKSKPKA